MAMLDVLSPNQLHDGSEPIPCGAGRYGIRDSIRLQEAAIPGMALSYQNSSDPLDYLNVYKFGSSSARPEFAGVLGTKGGSPTLACVATTTNDSTVSMLFLGYTPVLLAPGYAVRAGQYMEPIPAGTYQAYWRPCLGGQRGPARANESWSNVSGSAGVWVSATIIPQPSSLLVSYTTADSATFGPNSGDNAEKVFTLGGSDVFPTIPANTWTAGTSYAARVHFKFPNAVAGSNTFTARIRLGGLTGALLCETADVNMTDGGGDKGELEIVFRPRGTIGATMPVVASGLGGITPGEANGGIVAIGTASTLPTVDATASAGLQVVVTGQWSAVNAANQAVIDSFELYQLS